MGEIESLGRDYGVVAIELIMQTVGGGGGEGGGIGAQKALRNQGYLSLGRQSLRAKVSKLLRCFKV